MAYLITLLTLDNRHCPRLKGNSYGRQLRAWSATCGSRAEALASIHLESLVLHRELAYLGQLHRSRLTYLLACWRWASLLTAAVKLLPIVPVTLTLRWLW